MSHPHTGDHEDRGHQRPSEAAQEPEINTSTEWLTAWDQDVPDTSGGHDTGSMDMPGMMSDDDMTALGGASDADFEDMWLSMMIEHHERAVDMAETEVADGAYQPAVDLAGPSRPRRPVRSTP